MYDPAAIPGSAHFLEHMLFLGSKKYPEEGSFDALLAEHGGYSNAYTASENTNYFFAVSTDKFEKATDMFAQMFTSPLLTMSATNAEAHAIDAEHQKNHQNDGWRIEQVKQNLATPGHPFNRFGTGNADTLLKNVSQSHATLVQLYLGHYCVKNMHLTLLSSNELADTVKLAKEAFKDLRTTCEADNDENVGLGEAMAKTASMAYAPPYNQSMLESMVSIETLQSGHSLTLLWQVPPQEYHWEEKAAEYVGYHLSQIGKGSLTSKLKSKTSGISGGLGESYSMFSTFEVEIELNEEGAKEKDQIAADVLNYIALLRGEGGVSEARWKELKANSELQFNFKEKEAPEDYTSSVASSMRLYPLQQVLFAGSNYARFNATDIRAFLDHLVPSNLILIYATKNGELKDTLKDKYYGVEYKVTPFTEKQKSLFEAAANGPGHKGLALPPASKFIVDDTTVKELDAHCPTQGLGKDPLAKLVRNDYATKSLNENGERVVSWWLQEGIFKLPKTYVTVSLVKPAAYATATEQLTAKLFASVVSDALAEETDDATSAGYSCAISATSDGLEISVGGFSQHLEKFLNLVLQRISKPEKLLKAERFAAIKTSSQENMNNALLAEPYRLMSGLMNKALERPYWDAWQVKEALDDVKYEDIMAFKRQHLSDVAMEVFVFGNANSEDAKRITKVASQHLPCKAVSASLLEKLPPADISFVANPKQGTKSSFRAPPTDASNPNSCVENYFQYGIQRDGEAGERDRLYLAALGALAHGPAYDTLRTKEQLGYIVSSGGDRRGHVLGFKVLVESATKNATYLNSRITNFMDNILDPMVKNLDGARFAGVVSTLATQLTEPAQGASSVRATALSEVQSRTYRWDRRDKQLQQLKLMNVDEFKSFYTKLRAGGSVSVQLDHTNDSLATRRQVTPDLNVQADNSQQAICFQSEDLPVVLGSWQAKQDAFSPRSPSALPECELCA